MAGIITSWFGCSSSILISLFSSAVVTCSCSVCGSDRMTLLSAMSLVFFILKITGDCPWARSAEGPVDSVGLVMRIFSVLSGRVARTVARFSSLWSRVSCL